MLKWTWISVVVIILDQITKQLATAYLEYQIAVPVMPSFNLTLVHNTGAAFSFLSSAGGWQRWFFAVIAVVVSAGILYWLKKLEQGKVREALGLVLVLGGAVGNLIDRAVYGYVVDFIDIYYGTLPHWPAFNIADIAISLGAAILIFDALRPQRKS
ncbi:MAG: signal peptidase II [Chromatiales bacterium]|nr:signal peptidase II [Chromatiales bacterium]